MNTTDKLELKSHGVKYDSGKPRMDLLQLEVEKEIAKVLTFGAEKYSPNGWQSVPNAESRYFAALLRHLTAWQSGEDHDAESGLSHLAHAGCCLHFLIFFDLKKKVDNETQV